MHELPRIEVAGSGRSGRADKRAFSLTSLISYIRNGFIPGDTLSTRTYTLTVRGRDQKNRLVTDRLTGGKSGSIAIASNPSAGSGSVTVKAAIGGQTCSGSKSVQLSSGARTMSVRIPKTSAKSVTAQIQILQGNSTVATKTISIRNPKGKKKRLTSREKAALCQALTTKLR